MIIASVDIFIRIIIYTLECTKVCHVYCCIFTVPVFQTHWMSIIIIMHYAAACTQITYSDKNIAAHAKTDEIPFI